MKIPSRSEIDELYTKDKTSYSETQKQFLQENYYNHLKMNPKDLKKWNELAVILHLIGEDKEAMNILKKFE